MSPLAAFLIGIFLGSTIGALIMGVIAGGAR